MRRIRAPVESKPPDKKPATAMEPMGEGIRKERKPYGQYKRMEDGELLAKARAFVETNGIMNRTTLHNLNIPLYEGLRARKLIGTIFPLQKEKKPNGFYSARSDDELLALTKTCMADMELRCKKDLVRTNGGLYQALEKREKTSPGIMERAGLGTRNRIWYTLNDDELVKVVQEFMGLRGICTRKELSLEDRSLYYVLLKREKADPSIAQKISFMEKRPKVGRWQKIEDEELVGLARNLMEERGIGSKVELKDVDEKLYAALRSRDMKSPGLMVKVGFRKKIFGRWQAMGNEELIANANEYILKNGIKGRNDLNRENPALYMAIQRRRDGCPGIMGRLNFTRKKREETKWEAISDDELVGLAQKAMRERGIDSRVEMQRLEKKLYSALRRRELISPGIMGRVGFVQRHQNWTRLDDDEMVDFAKDMMVEKKICKKAELADANYGLYQALLKRRLLDRVFSPLEDEEKKQALRAIKKATEGFG